jgi:hypothetical protein
MGELTSALKLWVRTEKYQSSKRGRVRHRIKHVPQDTSSLEQKQLGIHCLNKHESGGIKVNTSVLLYHFNVILHGSCVMIAD